MKKIITLVLAAIMCVAAFSGCSSKETNDNFSAPSAAVTENKYGLDYDSTDVQDMSTEKADAATLTDVVQNWLGGYTMFMPGQDQGAYTYEDFVEKIGVDATTYNKDDSGKRVYTWIASDDSTAKFSACFEESGEKWLLSAVGSTNLI